MLDFLEKPQVWTRPGHCLDHQVLRLLTVVLIVDADDDQSCLLGCTGYV